MQVTETHADGLRREYTVLVSAKDIDEKITGRLHELGRKVNVPGFRPGKVPLKVLKQRFGRSVMGEVLEHAVGDTSRQAISERGLRPATQPKIEIKSFDEGKDLEYTMAVEVMPDIEPIDFSNVTLERERIKVEESAVEQTLKDLAEAHKRTRKPDKPRNAEHGDVLVIDFSGTVEGEVIPGLSAEDHHLELGSSSFVAGFEDQLLGVEVGQAREVRVTFPDNYPNDRLAGREGIFSVTVKDILEAVPAEIDDELAVSLGEQDLAALKERVRERIAKEYTDIARMRLKRRVLDKLAETHDFPVPEGMVEAEFDSIWKQIEAERGQGRTDPDDEGKTDDELRQEYRVIAERRVRLGLLLSEVGRRNGIEVNQEEVNRALAEEARRYPGSERQVIEFYQRLPQAMAKLQAPIFEDKVIDFIVDLAEVHERDVTPAQLRDEAETKAGAERAGADGKKPVKTKGGRTVRKKRIEKAKPDPTAPHAAETESAESSS